MNNPIRIDGSVLEGGGQLLRTAVALSAVTGKAIAVEKIRAKREKPGLRNQHLSAVRAVSELVGGEATGLVVGSQSIAFTPSKIIAHNYRVDVGTAGSTTLVLQALMPALAFAPDYLEVTLTGGTNNPLAPSVDYMTHILLPTIEKTGYQCHVELARRGFYPRGGGELRIKSRGIESLKPLNLTKLGRVKEVMTFAYSSRLPAHITQRMTQRATYLLRNAGYSDITSKVELLQANDPECAYDPGCGLLLSVEYESGLRAGFEQLGEKGKPAEMVAETVVESALKHLRAQKPVEPHLCDQLVIWSCLADGHSAILTSELTLHTLTCIEVVRQLLGISFRVEGEIGRPAMIECDGVALKKQTG